MITTELIDYIKSQLNKNISKELITSKLIQVGWQVEDIRDGFSQIEKELSPVKAESDFIPEKVQFPDNNPTQESLGEVKKIFDPYREIPDGVDVEQAASYKAVPKEEDKPFVSVLQSMGPINVTEKAPEEKPIVEEIKPIVEEKPIIEESSAEVPFVSVLDKMEPIKITKQPQVEVQKIEQDKQLDDIQFNDEEKEEILPVKQEGDVSAAKPFVSVLDKMEPIKIWVPSAVKAKPVNVKIEEVVVSPKTDIEPYMVEVASPVNSSVNSIADIGKKDEPIKTEYPKKESSFELIPTINKNNIFEEAPKKEISLEVPATKEEVKVAPVAVPVETNISHALEPQKPNPVFTSVFKEGTIKNNNTDIVKKSAIISSYTQDILSAQKEKEEVKPSKKKNLLLKWGIAIFVLSIISGVIFAFVEGSLRIPGLVKLSVVKDDPRTVLAETPLKLSQVKSYKFDTTVTVSSPALSNITTGLSSGDAIISKDKDNVSISSKGFVNHTDGKKILSYLFNLKSSIIDNDIKSDLKYDGNNLIATVPDLSFILKKDAPTPSTVSFKPEEIGLIISELSDETQDSIKKIDIYNILSGKIPEYVKTETALTFKDFISKLEYIDKGEELVRGNIAYHYELTAGNQTTKKLLTSLADLFILNLDEEQKKNLDEALRSSTISSFEVWVGKDDDNLYQIKFTLKAPLSKVLRLNDSGIAGNEVTLDWITTYYDFDVPNEINMPEQKISMDDFVNGIKNTKIKNIISSFKPNALSFKNSTGSYGARLNPSGSCTNPNPGTLFSPQGHSKGATNSISSISSSMNSLLSATNGGGFCYSNASSWALSAPLYYNSNETPTFYCADSKGNVVTLNNPIKGPVCE